MQPYVEFWMHEYQKKLSQNQGFDFTHQFILKMNN